MYFFTINQKEKKSKQKDAFCAEVICCVYLKKKKKMLKVQHRLMNLGTIFLGHFHCTKKTNNMQLTMLLFQQRLWRVHLINKSEKKNMC